MDVNKAVAAAKEALQVGVGMEANGCVAEGKVALQVRRSGREG